MGLFCENEAVTGSPDKAPGKTEEWFILGG